MKTKCTFLLLVTMLISCGPQLKVYTDFAPEGSPAFYVTYDWKIKSEIELGRHPIFYNELNDQRIKAAVNQQLAVKGYSLNEQDPQLLAHYHIVIQDEPFVSIPYDYDYANFEYWVNQHPISSYKEGTLIIDFMEAKTNNLLWRGWAVAVLEEAYPPEKVKQLIELSVGKVMKDFPMSAVGHIENDSVINY